jgi:hypothetical protein
VNYKIPESCEAKAWNNCDLQDLWIFDKLIVAKRAGHICGPRGIPVPKAGEYFVKPITNIEGMGEKARVEYIEDDTRHLHPGEFWCEIFTGDHISVDYNKYIPVLSVIGQKHDVHKYSRFTRWDKTTTSHPLPQFIGLIPLRYRAINCEFIGGKLIEIHLRGNPDFAYGNNISIPVWIDEPDPLPAGYTFVSDQGSELDRLGIWVDKYTQPS